MLSIRYACQISIELDFSRRVFKSTQTANLTKIRPVGAELFHADGWTDGQTWRN
jgi:hypothetical protein